MQLTAKGQKYFQGISINAGKVFSAACLYSAERHKAVEEYRLENDKEVKEEIRRYEEALKVCAKELDVISNNVAGKVGKAEAEIFTTQKHIMNDPEIVRGIRRQIADERKNAEAAIFEVFAGYEAKFSSLDNEYLRERATDIGEIRRRLLDHLRNTKPGLACEGQEFCTRGMNRIIVAEELTVGMIVHMNFEKVLGFVTEHGGITSHAAILARSLGVPAISGIRGIMERVHCGDLILIDGDAGAVYVDPDRETLASVMPAEQLDLEKECFIRTPEGFEVFANVSLFEDIKLANSMKADGIGLFRTEILFLTADRLLNEEEQYAYYLKAMQENGDRPITFRLMDVGGDKPLPFLKLQAESNPYLGWRGARFLLGNPDLFSVQVRALARLSKKGKIRILFPMVVDAAQQEKLRRAVNEFLLGTGAEPQNIWWGTMFEVPSACLEARRIFEMVDFASVGSNDLIQYLFAVDRGNEMVSQDYNPDHPVLWEVLKSLSAFAREANKPLSICGEMAGRDGMPGRLAEAGIRSLSVTPRLIPRVRNELVRHVPLQAK